MNSRPWLLISNQEHLIDYYHKIKNATLYADGHNSLKSAMKALPKMRSNFWMVIATKRAFSLPVILSEEVIKREIVIHQEASHSSLH